MKKTIIWPLFVSILVLATSTFFFSLLSASSSMIYLKLKT